MATIINKYFHLLFIIFIIFGINIIKVAASEDCDAFSKVLPYIENDDFKKQFGKELNCCFVDSIITCDPKYENIISVVIDGKNATNVESILMEMENLKHLTTLVVTGSKLSYIPDNIGNIKQLENLNLASNKIKSGIPSSIGDIESLRILNLSNNNITGTIPSNFKKLKKLTYLNLSNNDLEGYIPIDLIEMSSIEELYLENNEHLDGYVPPFPAVTKCTYENTELCTLKGEKCPAPIQCYKEEIEDGNKHNGSTDPNKYVDKAITDKSERKVDTHKSAFKKFFSNKTVYYVIGIVVLVLICCCCCCCCCCGDSDSSSGAIIPSSSSDTGGVLVIRRTITRIITASSS